MQESSKVMGIRKGMRTMPCKVFRDKFLKRYF